jgi:HPr kinase/phosphorylase
MVRRVSRGRLFSEASPNLGSHMEIRGIGIIDIERLFGVRSIRSESEISLIVQLEKWDPNKEYERLGLEEDYVELFDCQVPQVVMPVEPGRNIAQLVEIASLTQRLRYQGVNLAQDFDKRIRHAIDRNAPPRSRRSS